MNISVTWNPGDTWRKLGYFYYTNSLEYRSVIEQNPQWSVFEEPPIGTVISLEVDSSRTLGTTNTSGFFATTATDLYEQEKYFPFEYKAQYEAQAAKYSIYSLVNFNELNGYTQDTPEAQTGNP